MNINTLNDVLVDITNSNLHDEIKSRANLYIEALTNTEGLLEFFREVMSEVASNAVDDPYSIDDLVHSLPDAIKMLVPEAEMKEAVAKLAAAVKMFKSNLSEAEEIATKYGLAFSLEPAYGMGGRFEAGYWNASSRGC